MGSAVFNVLFVIGACAIFSKGVLALSWWPLFRDATYYTIGLLTLAVFFGTGAAAKGERQSEGDAYTASMDWYECLILLILYVGYVFMMKHNRWLHFHLVKKCKKSSAQKAREKAKRDSKKAKNVVPSGGGSTGGTPSANNTKVSPAGSEKRPMKLMRRDSSRSVLLEQLARRAQEGSQEGRDVRRSALHFRAGVLHLMVSEKSLLETAGIHLVTKVQGDVKATFKSVAGENETITKTDLRRLLGCMGLSTEVTDKEVTAAFTKLDKNNDGSLDWPEFKEW